MLLEVQSMTDAVRMKRKLNNMGISANVVQSRGAKRKGGCGYAVRIPDVALSIAERAANEAGIRLSGVQRSDGG